MVLMQSKAKQPEIGKFVDDAITPGRYWGLPDEEDYFNFAEYFSSLKAELKAQLKEEAELNRIIGENLLKIRLLNE